MRKATGPEVLLTEDLRKDEYLTHEYNNILI